jgi:hypothetical protein
MGNGELTGNSLLSRASLQKHLSILDFKLGITYYQRAMAFGESKFPE